MSDFTSSVNALKEIQSIQRPKQKENGTEWEPEGKQKKDREKRTRRRG